MKIRMDHLYSYPESLLKDVVKDLRDSPLLEKLTAMEEILIAIEENAKKHQAYKYRKCPEYLAKQLKETERNIG